MSKDISKLLEDWEYDPDNSVRIVHAEDGRQIMQVRLPLGLEQYEMDGRPDGRKLSAKDTVLDEMQDRLSGHIMEHATSDGFSISNKDFMLLQNEGILFYYRYLQLFQIGDFERTARDTEHNLRICEMVEKFAEKVEDKASILQYKPYILRINAIAKAMLSLHKNLKLMARKVIESAIVEIKKMPEIDTPAFHFEKIRSINYLKTALKQILEKQDDPVEQLKSELEEAIKAEEYEKAAEIRDRLYHMEN
ncbi:MAG: excinuclease ABC subunit B [Spirochaetales bacterium]|nr:MAG: excinuclease ABC subunit B [Spirochaetales bacterium]